MYKYVFLSAEIFSVLCRRWPSLGRSWPTLSSLVLPIPSMGVSALITLHLTLFTSVSKSKAVNSWFQLSMAITNVHGCLSPSSLYIKYPASYESTCSFMFSPFLHHSLLASGSSSESCCTFCFFFKVVVPAVSVTQ